MNKLLLSGRRLFRKSFDNITWSEIFSLNRNFNSGILGSSVNGQVDGFDDAGGGTTYDNTHVQEGLFSGKCTITTAVSDPPGNGGFGSWGGIVEFPQTVNKQKDIWVKMFLFLPNDFIISTPGNQSLKTIRLRTSAGFFDLQMRDDGQPGSFRAIKEGYATDWVYFGDAGLITRDVWHELILHIHLDDVQRDLGGLGSFRFWFDGQLLVDSGHLKTLTNAEDVIDALYVFTYWNGSVPQDQSCWIDDITVSAGSGTPVWATHLTSN